MPTKPKKTKKPKKITKAQQKKKARTSVRKALALWSKAVRDRDGNKCCVCDKTEFLNAHHVIPKERFPKLKLEVENGVSLCPSHHKFGSYSAHRHPLWFAHWLQTNRPEQYAWVIAHLYEDVPCPVVTDTAPSSV